MSFKNPAVSQPFSKKKVEGQGKNGDLNNLGQEKNLWVTNINNASEHYLGIRDQVLSLAL